MAKQIKKNDIAEQDLFGNIRKSAESTIIVLKKMEKTTQTMAAGLKKGISGAKFGNVEEIQKFIASTEKLNKVLKQKLVIEKQLTTAEKQKTQAEIQEEKVKKARIATESAELRLAQQKKAIKEKEIKQRERSAKLAKDEANAYKKLSKRTTELKNESKRLGAEMYNLEQSGKKGTKQWRQVQNQYKRTTAEASKLDAKLKQIDSSVGDNQRNVGNYSKGIGKLKGALGQLGLAFGAFQLLRNAGKTVVEFEQTIANLSAITGATGKDLDFLKEKAMQLGGATTLSATQVAEGFKLIGSAKPELLQDAEALAMVTEQSIMLAEAAGMTLPEAAAALTNTLNQFGASAAESGKFVDILAAGAKAGAGDINYLNAAFEKAGTIAKTAGMSFLETGAAIEVIAKSGVPAQKAGTDLKNVILNLQKAGKGFSTGQFELKEALEQSKKELDAMEDPALRAAAAIKLYGKDSEGSAEFLMANLDLYDELTVAMDENGIAAEQQAKNTDTLQGALARMASAWEEFILRLNEGSGIGNVLKVMLDGLAANFKTIMHVLGTLVQSFIAYKAILLGVQAQQWIMNGGLKELGKNLILGAKNMFKFGKAAKTAGKDVATAGKAATAIPWMLLISLVLELAKGFYDWASGAAEARAQSEATADAVAKAQEKETEVISERRKNMVKLIAIEQRLRNEKKISEKEFLEREEKIKKAAKEEAQRSIDQLKRNQKTTATVNKRLETLKKAESAVTDMAGYDRILAQREKEIQRLRDAGVEIIQDIGDVWNVAEPLIETATREGIAAIDAFQKQIDLETMALEELNEEVLDATSNVKANAISVADNSKVLDGHSKGLAFNIQLRKELNDLLSEEIGLQERLAQIEFDEKIKGLNKKIESEMSAQGNDAELTGIINVDLLESLLNERKDMLIDAITEERDFEISEMERLHSEKFANLTSALQKEYDAKVLAAKGNKKKLALIEEDFKRESQEILDVQAQDFEVLQTRKTVAVKEANLEILDVEKTTSDEINDKNEELITKQEKFAQQSNKIVADETKQFGDTMKENLQTMISSIDYVTNYFKRSSDERIAQYDKEIKAAENQYSVYQELAKNGNIDAKESLAEQNDIIAEANRKKLQEEKRQRQFEMASAALKTYLRNVDNPDVKNPITKTLTDITLLQTFLATLPAFEEGTEDTGTNGRGVDGKGGFNAILHPNERVMTKEQNKLVGDLSNDKLAQIANDYQNGAKINLGSGAVDISKPWSVELIDEVRELSNIIKNKPETNIELEGIIDGAMKITRETKKGNNITYNRYKIR